MVNLDGYGSVLKTDIKQKTMLVQSGIRLRDLNLRAKEHGMTIQNLGSVDDQSVVGAISTGTHGSTLKHGLLSQNVRALRIVLSNGSAVRCSPEQNEDLFRAALLSLGALGIIVEVELQLGDACNIEWIQTIEPLDDILTRWETDLWTEAEFTRVWWLPYTHRAVIWKADETGKSKRAPQSNWYGGALGFHTYHILLWISNYFPRLLPSVEWFVFGMQYGFSNGTEISAVEEKRTGLLMNCLYSQFVNEWAIPLEKGPEAIRRLSAWVNGNEKASDIPFTSKGLWVHSPVEVRVSDTSTTRPRPYLDPSYANGPTLYLNATLYRPYLRDPPCYKRYYQAFEWLMKDMGGKPHWAKNFATATHDDIKKMYGEDLTSFLRIRNEVDPEGMFIGEWHRRYLLPPASEQPHMALEEREKDRKSAGEGDGIEWTGEQTDLHVPESTSSEESFDIMHEPEAAASVVLR
jgi:D-arabinono-1,4-lactone oxidase